MKTVFISLLALTSISAWAIEELDHFKDTGPNFNVVEFFDGPLKAYGVIKNRSGKVTRRFDAEMHGKWEDGVGTITEDFKFYDGENMKREWTLTPQADGSYTATASDVEGNGTLHAKGCAVLMHYKLVVPYKESTVKVNVKDWLYLQGDNVVVNHTHMTKFGFRVGEIVTTIIKQ